MKNYPDNDLIFHFTKLKTAAEYILPTMELRFGEFTNSNDPFEYKSNTIGPKYGCIVYGNTDLDSVISQIFIQRRKKYNFISFCKNPIDQKLERYGWCKPRMWAQYGDNHDGICLVFSKNKLIEHLSSIYPSDILFIDDIDYYNSCINTFREYQIIDQLKLKEMGINKYIDYHIDKYQKRLLFSKDIDFEDESEFRILLKNEMDEYIKFKIDNSLIGIILGDKVPKVYYELFKQFNVKLTRMHFDEGLPTIQNIPFLK